MSGVLFGSDVLRGFILSYLEGQNDYGIDKNGIPCQYGDGGLILVRLDQTVQSKKCSEGIKNQTDEPADLMVSILTTGGMDVRVLKKQTRVQKWRNVQRDEERGKE